MKLKANEILEIGQKYGAWMFEEAAERGYDAKAAAEARKDLDACLTRLNVPGDKVQPIAYYASDNFSELKEAGEEELEV